MICCAAVVNIFNRPGCVAVELAITPENVAVTVKWVVERCFLLL